MYVMNEKKNMLKKIHALDFAIHELVLFLDTHPTDAQALAAVREYAEKARVLRERYESCYGSLTGVPCDCGDWKWIDDPWPWEYTCR